MKKYVFIVCLLAAFLAQAQYDTLPYNIGRPYYYMMHPLDSMHLVSYDNNGTNTFIIPMPGSLRLQILSNNPTYVTLLSNPGSPNSPYADSGDLAYGFYPDSTINIIGLAWYNPLWPSFDDSSMMEWDTIEVKLYLPEERHYLYPIAIKKIAYDTFSYNKVMDCSRGWAESDWTQYLVNYPTAPFYEVYFDSLISLSDSFYISVKYTWNTKPLYNQEIIAGWGGHHSPPSPTGPHTFPLLNYRVRDSVDFNWPWTSGHINAYPLLFPIIRRECDSCPEVHEVHYTKVGNSAAIAQWDAGANHLDWQICYGTPGFDPNGAQSETARVPQWALTGLSSTAHYDVYVRARCQFDQIKYTPWAGPFDLCLAEIGIEGADAVSIEVGPNPTMGTLTVGCEAEIKEVEMYDMQGRMISGKWKEESGKCVVLDLTGLSAGSYILVAHTTKGVATRTVEKR